MFDVESKVINIEIGEGKDADFEFELICTSEDVILRCMILEPYLLSAKEWRELITAIETQSDWCRDFYGGNGEGLIECDGKYFECRACPSGAGGDFSVGIKLSLDTYGEVLAYRFKQLLAHPVVRAYYEE